VTKPPAFQFYARDIYTGTSDLSPAEFGAYVRGLAWSWDNGPLPSDPSRRARVLLTTPQEHAAIWPVLEPLWQSTVTGWVNDRLERQRQELAAFTQQQSVKGEKGAAVRWRGHVPVNGRKIAAAIAEPMTEPSPDDDSPISDLRSPEDHKHSSTVPVFAIGRKRA
jgi:uncharacterized protein YdaU (DUF1376 family)